MVVFERTGFSALGGLRQLFLALALGVGSGSSGLCIDVY